MKNRVDKIVVLLFVVAMCFLMSVSAHAETGNRHFFTSSYLPARIELDGMSITPTNVSGGVTADSRTIFNESVSHYARVRSDQNNATKFTIETQSKGVLLVYYARQFDGKEPVANDDNDLKIENLNGVAEYCQKESSPCYGVKYYVLDANTSYIMTTATGSKYTCGVYGFVYMPGNVAAYDSKNLDNLCHIGQWCEDSYDNLPVLKNDSCYCWWYKDAACTERVTGGKISEPTIVYLNKIRYIWDFTTYPVQTIGSDNVMYDGIDIKGDSYYQQKPNITSSGLQFRQAATPDYQHLRFVPKYDGDLIVTYMPLGDWNDDEICVIGTAVVSGSTINDFKNNENVLVCDETNEKTLRTVSAKLKAGVPYYIYTAHGGIYIRTIKYVAGAASPDVAGNNVTLTTTANMQGWRAFYDAENSYTVDDNTSVYMVVGAEGDDEVKLCNRTGKKVPKGSPVILHTDAEQEDGTYLITMTKDDTPYVYDGNDNMLCASEAGSSVNAYRLGYRAGDNNGVAFYPWSADSPSAGIVYLDLEISNAKVGLGMDEDMTGIVSVRKDDSDDRKIFNLKGLRLSAPQKGFNIINGKKIIVL